MAPSECMPVPEVAKSWAVEREYGAVGEVAIFTYLLSLDSPTLRDLGFRRIETLPSYYIPLPKIALEVSLGV